ncbi:hypothetical protein E3O44_03470 [Cryobacterium algoricola]|uniref:Uncharacterized protein n=1 Tax=Cryobacterium algoricola TaxID=1259183 RepID=A0ABY2IH72_9MICO|nr:hypothetical protein E3O44_03470 [Cryobacterium algoricola]
MAGILKDNSRL